MIVSSLQEALRTAVVGLVIIFLLPLAAPYYLLVPLGAFAILALSLALVWGVAGILCFGQGAFFGLGAYAFAIASINYATGAPGIFFAILVPAVAGLLLGALMFYGRLSSLYLAVVTLVFTLILYRYMIATAGPEYAIGNARLGGFNGIPRFPTITIIGSDADYISEQELYFVTFVLLLLSLVFMQWLKKSSFGRICIAIRENERRCSLVGYDVRQIKTAVFTIGAAFAGLAGSLYANWAGIVTPNLFALTLSAETIMWVIVGGVGSLVSPMVAAMILVYLKFLLSEQTVISNQLVMGVVLVVVVLLLPSGRRDFLARLFNRNQISPTDLAKARPVITFRKDKS